MHFIKVCLTDLSEGNSNFDVAENCLFIKVNDATEKKAGSGQKQCTTAAVGQNTQQQCVRFC